MHHDVRYVMHHWSRVSGLGSLLCCCQSSAVVSVCQSVAVCGSRRSVCLWVGGLWDVVVLRMV